MMRGNGLSDAYTATLTRLKAQKGDKPALGLKVLMWVLYSERPLRAAELRHALGVEVGSADLDLEYVPSLRTVLSSCLGLVTIEASSSTLRLVHFTLQEHLLRYPALFNSPHSTIAEACLTYLNFKHVCDLSPTLGLAPPEMPLLEYASLYWGNHAKRGITENIKILALRLLGGFDEHICARLLLLHYSEARGRSHWFLQLGESTGFTGLHGVAFLGVVEMVLAVLKMKEWDINAADCIGRTPLTWAARRGHEEVVKMLLERGDVNPNQADTYYGQTPLWQAGSEGHKGVVKLLLGREDVNPNRADTYYGQTPLWQACSEGHEGVVKLLLDREDVNPNQADTERGRTPLWMACYRGHEGVVKLLLEREDVNPNQADTERGRTPLWRACSRGNEGVVKLLLEREDVNPNQADTNYDQTPLFEACSHGHEGVVKLLLEREDVNPNQADTEYGQTPLFRACSRGHEGVVKLLLDREDVNPNQVDTERGRTPLWMACYRGHEGVVKLLLEREDVNPNQADNEYGETPFLLAAQDGYKGIVQMLLQRQDIDPDHPDTKFGITPLQWAAAGGHEDVVKAILEGSAIRAAMPDNLNQTPQLWASSQGHDAVVRLLPEQGDPNSDAESRAGQTPHSSAPAGGECVVEMKFTIGPNTDPTDRIGQPALLSPGSHGREQVLDPKNSGSMSHDSDPPATEPLNLPQPSSMRPLKFSYPVVNRYWIIAAFICLLALFAYLLPSSLLDPFSLQK